MNFDSYKNTLDYPSRDRFKTKYWYRGGKVVATKIADGPILNPESVEIETSQLAGTVTEVVYNDAGFRAAREVYSAKEMEIYAQFKQDLFEDLGITHHPLREKLFSKAWEDGHSAGYQEVHICAENLVELIEIPAGYVLVGPETIIGGAGTKTPKVQQAAMRLSKELT